MTAAADLQRIYDRRIQPHLFSRAEPHPAPIAALIGAQPGAGKSRSAVNVQKLAHPQQLTPIIGDDLRIFHPDYDRLIRTDPLTMPDATAPALSQWVETAIATAQRERFPVLVEGTFRRPEVTSATVRDFRNAGFDVHLVALAVPDWESRLGILERYVEDHALNRAARWTDLEAHDRSYVAAPTTIAEAIGTGEVNRVTVLNRAGQVLHDTRMPVVAEVLAALEAGRSRLPSGGELEANAERLEDAIAHLQQTGQLTERTVPLVEAIRQDRDALARVAGPGGMSSGDVLRLAMGGVPSPNVTRPPSRFGPESSVSTRPYLPGHDLGQDHGLTR